MYIMYMYETLDSPFDTYLSLRTPTLAAITAEVFKWQKAAPQAVAKVGTLVRDTPS